MDDKGKDIKVGFQLKRVTTEQFAIIDSAYDKNYTKVDLDVGIKFGIDKEHRIVASFVSAQFKQNDSVFLKVEVAGHFEVEADSWNGFLKDDSVVIPKGFASHLVMLTIGTLRGVLHCKTENTEFNKFLLPAVNVAAMIPNDVILKQK